MSLTEGRLTESGGMRGLQAATNRVTEDHEPVAPTVPPTIAGQTTLQTSGSGTRTITPHAGVVDGDLLVVSAIGGTNTSSHTPPGGWTQLLANTVTGTMTTGCWARVRQSGDTTYAYTIAASATSTHICLNIRDWSGTIGDVVAGTGGTRAASGGTTVTTAPSVTTTVDESLVLCIATERTTATETGITSVGNGFTEYVWVGHGATGIESTWIGTKEIATAGATGTTSVTYPNTQASNGIAFHLAIPPL